MTRDGFNRWLQTAQPGERCIYHIGNLAEDRGDPNPRTGYAPQTEGELNVDRLASAVADACEGDLIICTQRRIGPEEAEYIAIRTLAGR